MRYSSYCRTLLCSTLWSKMEPIYGGVEPVGTSRVYQRVMLERFFLTPQANSDEPDPITLLSGPPSSGKTSLLFQFALNSAADNATVVILCNRRKLESNPPFLSQGVDPSSDIFERIQIKYVEDEEGIKNFFAAFHLFDIFPLSVIIYDFADFFDERTCRERYNNPRGRNLAMVRVLALCRNAIDHARKKAPCKLVLSDTHRGDMPRQLYIYKRWISSIYTIKEGDAARSFILRKMDTGTAIGERVKSAKYSIALQYLVLEGINS